MKKDIIFAGVGGQGIVSIAMMLAEAVSEEGLHVKQNEVHGMAQRGGAVESHVRISDQPIYSDMIPKGAADIILSTEPMEALRYTEFLQTNGVILTNNQPVKNIEYPDLEKILGKVREIKNSVIVDTEAITKELGNPKAANMAMLGALLKALNMDHVRTRIEKKIEARFAKKGENVVKGNLKALHLGMEAK